MAETKKAKSYEREIVERGIIKNMLIQKKKREIMQTVDLQLHFSERRAARSQHGWRKQRKRKVMRERER